MSAREGARLGRGLAALMGESTAEGEAGSDPRMLPLHAIEPGPFQPRRQTDPTALDELAASIRAQGVLQPILVRPHPDQPGRYQIVAGERRWRASQIAGLDTIPVMVRPLETKGALAAALVENLQRDDLNPIEEAEGFQRLMQEFALTQEQLGQAVGKSRSHVANTMRILNLPQSVRVEIANGRLSAGHARALLACADPEKSAARVLQQGLNVRQTEALAAEKTGEKRPERIQDPETESLAQSLSERLGLRVEIAADGNRGTVRIRYRTLDQLDGVVTLLLGGERVDA